MLFLRPALCLAASLGVCLLAVGVATPAQAAYQAVFVFSNCTAEQEQAVRIALNRVDTKLDELLGKFDSHEVEPFLGAWFGDNAAVDRIRTRYQRIRDMLNLPITISISCEERHCEKDLFGYTLENAISVCPGFFAAKPGTGYDTQAGTLVHEFTHSYAGTNDYVYGSHKARELAHFHPDQALRNADSYQYFFEAVTGDRVRYRNAPWTPDNSCQWAYDGECDHPDIGTGNCSPDTDVTDCKDAPPALPPHDTTSPTQ